MDLLAVQGTLKSLLQHYSSKTSILQHSAFFTVQLSHPYMTTGKIIALTRWTLVGKVMSLLLNILSRLVITFLPRREKEKYTHLTAELQRIAKRGKKAFFSNQCKEIEENNRMRKTRDLFKKIRNTKGIFQANMGTIKDRNYMDLT